MEKFIRKNNVLIIEKESNKFYNLTLEISGNVRLIKIGRNLAD